MDRASDLTSNVKSATQKMPTPQGALLAVAALLLPWPFTYPHTPTDPLLVSLQWCTHHRHPSRDLGPTGALVHQNSLSSNAQPRPLSLPALCQVWPVQQRSVLRMYTTARFISVFCQSEEIYEAIQQTVSVKATGGKAVSLCPSHSSVGKQGVSKHDT